MREYIWAGTSLEDGRRQNRPKGMRRDSEQGNIANWWDAIQGAGGWRPEQPGHHSFFIADCGAATHLYLQNYNKLPPQQVKVILSQSKIPVDYINR